MSLPSHLIDRAVRSLLEMAIDSRKKSLRPHPFIVSLEVMDQYEHLSTILDNTLKSEQSSEKVIQKKKYTTGNISIERFASI